MRTLILAVAFSVLGLSGVVQSQTVKQTEHAAVFALVPDTQVTHRASASGPWSDPATWENGVVPVNGAHVLIPVGEVVAIDTELTTRIATIRVDGRLRFRTDADTQLLVDTMVVDHAGVFECGTEAQPVQKEFTARIVFINNGPIDTVWDPLLFSRGLIAHGTTHIHGNVITSHSDAVVHPLTGHTQLVVNDTTGWQVGDRLLVPSVLYEDADEVVTIAAINGGTVQINETLARDHAGPDVSYRIPIANLNRNVKFSSEAADHQQRGHVMQMHNLRADVSYASFTRVSRTDKRVNTTDPVLDGNGVLVPGTGDNPRGRYAVHFHRGDPAGDPAQVTGCVVEDNEGWGFVNHDSHVIFNDCVTFAIKGSGFVTELGSERGAFGNCVAVRSYGPGWHPTTSFSKDGAGTGEGSMGHGFWFQGSNVDIIDCVASGHKQEALFYSSRHNSAGRPEVGYFDDRYMEPGTVVGPFGVTIQTLPYGVVRNNAAFGSLKGFALWWHNVEVPIPTKLFDGLDLWNIRYYGIQFGYNWGLNIDRLRAFSDGGSWPLESIGVLPNVGSRNVFLTNAEVRGFDIGISSHPFHNTIVRGAAMANKSDFLIQVHAKGPVQRDVVLENITHETYADRVWAVEFSDPGDFTGQVAKYDFGTPASVYHNGRELYYKHQALAGVPFPSTAMPQWFLTQLPEYVDQTSQQLLDDLSYQYAGKNAPASAYDGAAALIDGLVEDNVVVPDLVDYTFETKVIAGPLEETALSGPATLYWVIESADLPDSPDWRVQALRADNTTVNINWVVVTPLVAGSTWLIEAPMPNLTAGDYVLLLDPQFTFGGHDPWDKIRFYLGNAISEVYFD